jgi:sugar/nucleoside kinase (ribokinase family)
MAHRSTFDVLGVGTNSVDTVLRLPHTPQPGTAFSKVHVNDKLICMGGQTATAMAACASLGLRAAYLGPFGSDDHGRRMREALAARGVNLDHAVERDAANHYAVILVNDANGERMVLWGRDARLDLVPSEISADAIASARLVHVDDVDMEAALRAATLARQAGIPVTSDLDRVDERTPDLVRAVSVPIFAEHMTQALTGETDHERGLRKLRREHDGLLCVTLGERGAMALDGDRLVHVPAFHIDPVDTTGAGDVFRGGFILGLLSGWPVERILRFANAAAAASCLVLGAMNGVPARANVERLLAHGRC